MLKFAHHKCCICSCDILKAKNNFFALIILKLLVARNLIFLFGSSHFAQRDLPVDWYSTHCFYINLTISGVKLKKIARMSACMSEFKKMFKFATNLNHKVVSSSTMDIYDCEGEEKNSNCF